MAIPSEPYHSISRVIRTFTSATRIVRTERRSCPRTNDRRRVTGRVVAAVGGSTARDGHRQRGRVGRSHHLHRRPSRDVKGYRVRSTRG
jgi:hypothetical protein